MGEGERVLRDEERRLRLEDTVVEIDRLCRQNPPDLDAIRAARKRFNVIVKECVMMRDLRERIG